MLGHPCLEKPVLKNDMGEAHAIFFSFFGSFFLF
jgi:hypothetical protein